jgi:hypothetical protein
MEQLSHILRAKGVVLNENEMAEVLSKIQAGASSNNLHPSSDNMVPQHYQTRNQHIPTPPPMRSDFNSRFNYSNNSAALSGRQNFFNNKNESSPLKRRSYDPTVASSEKQNVKPSRVVMKNAAVVVQKHARGVLARAKLKRVNTYNKKIASLRSPTTSASSHKFGKHTTLEHSATVVQKHMRGVFARKYMKSLRGKQKEGRIYEESLVKEKDFLKWGQPKDQNSKYQNHNVVVYTNIRCHYANIITALHYHIINVQVKQ